MLIHDKLKRLYKSVQRPVESAWTVYLVEKWRALVRKLGYTYCINAQSVRTHAIVNT